MNGKNIVEDTRKNNIKNEIYQLEKSRIPQIEDEVRYKMENMQYYKCFPISHKLIFWKLAQYQLKNYL